MNDIKEYNRKINKAIENCLNSNHNVSDHFIGTDKMINLAKNAIRKIQDYKLTRYACYLIIIIILNIQLLVLDDKTYANTR